MTVLWHDQRPIGICVFSPGPRILSQRNRYFGRKGTLDRLELKAINAQLLMLSRVVLHPDYRGAGIATRFVLQSARFAPADWIESQSQMGWFNPFLERAGFIRVGSASNRKLNRMGYSLLHGAGEVKPDGNRRLVSRQTLR